MLGKRHVTAMMILALAVFFPSIGQVSEAVARSPADCLVMGEVRNHEVVDAATILYVLKDGSMYVNLLNKSCPGVKEIGLPVYESGGGRFLSIVSYLRRKQSVGKPRTQCVSEPRLDRAVGVGSMSACPIYPGLR